MGLFDKIFGKRGPSSSSAPEAPVNEAAELRNQNLILQKLVESLQAKVALVRSEAVIAVPIQPVSTELSEHPSIHVPASNLPANESVGVGAQEQDELTVAMREKVEWVETELASAVRKAAVLHLANSLRQLLTERLLADLHDSKLEILRLCDEAIDLQRPESSALPAGWSIADDRSDDMEELREKLVIAAKDKHELEIRIQHAKEAQERLTLEEQKELIARKVWTASAVLRDQLADVRNLLDLASAKLHDQKQLMQRIDAAEIENSALKKGVGSEVWALKHKLELQTKAVASLNDQLGRSRFYEEAQAKRLAEREATINKNFAELQRRENELRDAKSAMAGCTPEVLSALREKVKDLRDQVELQRRENELQDAKSAMAGCTPEVLSALREKVKNLQDQVSAVTLSSRQKLMRLQEELEAADGSLQSLLAAKSELEKLLDIARRKNLSPTERVKVSVGSNVSLASLSDQRIVDWMLEDASPEQAEVEHGYLSLVGEGPWREEQFGLLMEQHGFSLWQLPDQDVRHVVVGRTNWDAEALDKQIASMGEMELRIYSQEMWFAKLVTGRDPFSSGDHDLLMAFAKGHDALQYLIARDNPWPDVTSQDLVVGDGVFTEGAEFGATSPLHNFGYQVGASSGLSKRERRIILANFLEARSLTFDDQSSEDYRSHWGRPRSVQRLFRVALHIKWLIGWQGKSPFRAQANEEWTEDLKWLKNTFYKPSSHKFKWPAL